MATPRTALVIPGMLLDRFERVLVLARVVASQSGNQQAKEDLNVLFDLLELGGEGGSSARATTVSNPASLGNELLTVSQAANRMGCSPQAIRKACGEGRLKADRVGRDWVIRLDELNTYRYGGTR